MLSSVSPCATPAGRTQEPAGPHRLCQRVPAEQWVLTPTHVSPEAQTLGQRAGIPLSPMWICLSHISPAPSSPEPPSSSLSPGITHTLFRGWGRASLEIKSHPTAAIDGTGPALGRPSVSRDHQPSQRESQPRALPPHRASRY